MTNTAAQHDAGHEVPPPIDPVNTIDLVSTKDSKITNVSLYSSQAEITRLFKIEAVTGLNQVKITGLPNVLDDESIKIEGRGAAAIHDVTIGRTPLPPNTTTSSLLKSLEAKKLQAVKALARCQKSIASLETYMQSVQSQHTSPDQLPKIVETYARTAEGLDDQVTQHENTIEELSRQIDEEKARLAGPVDELAEKLGKQVGVGIFAESNGELEVILKYAVASGSWTAAYDIRANMNTKERPIILVYKSIVTQNTGEDWTDVDLVLETTTPSYGVNVPTLDPWWINVYQPYHRPAIRKKGASFSLLPVGSALPSVTPSFGGGTGRSLSHVIDQIETNLASAEYVAPLADRETFVATRGGAGVIASFQVPGLVNIPTDGNAHTFTIAKLELDAELSWLGVPKREEKVHLQAKIHNTSDYTLLPGTASVYVNGSFIARSFVPSVSPQEDFDCSLGIDPSVRITYHPRSTKQSESGLYMKYSNQTFTQRLTIHNTKTLSIDNLKIIDQIPLSGNTDITVKLVQPALPPPSSAASSNAKSTSRAGANSTAIKVSENVTAIWDGMDEPDCDPATAGQDGKLNWMCSVPAQGKLNLSLVWEVNCPSKQRITGL